jgi:hypothetical protein
VTRTARTVLAVAGVLAIGLGLLLGLVDRTYSVYPDRQSCGPVLAPTAFVVSDADDPLVDEAARCAGIMAEASPPVWTLLGAGGVLLLVGALGGGGSLPVSRPPVVLESGEPPARS